MGRPPALLTPLAVQDVICRSVARGDSMQDAADLAGVGRTTLQLWKRLGEEQPGSIYADFLSAIREAGAKARRKARRCISKAIAQGDWQAARFYLTHAPEEGGTWAPAAQRLEHTGAGGAPLPAPAAPVFNITPVLDPRGLSASTLQELAREYAAAQPPEPAPAGGAAPVPGDRSGDPA